VEWRMVEVAWHIPSPRTRLPLPSALSLASSAKHTFPPLVFSRHALPLHHSHSQHAHTHPHSHSLPKALVTQAVNLMSVHHNETNEYNINPLLSSSDAHQRATSPTLLLRILIHNPHNWNTHSSNRHSMFHAKR
jgi:hypothetical protein